MSFPVHYAADKPARYARSQLIVRFVALVILGLVGLSLGVLYLVAYLALPAFAAARLSGGRDAEAYHREDGPRIARGLAWFASIYAWFGLVAEELPLRASRETVHVSIEPDGRPTPASALWRLLTGLPSAIVLVALGWIAGFVWLWSAFMVLFRQRVGDLAFRYLAGVQRWSLRLLAYQASLVDEYPPFSFEDEPALPSARALP